MNWDNWVLTFRIELNLFFLIWSEANMSGHACKTEQAFYQLISYTPVWQFSCLDKSMLIKHLGILCVYSCVTDIIKVFHGKTKLMNWKTSSHWRVSMLLWFMLWIALLVSTITFQKFINIPFNIYCQDWLEKLNPCCVVPELKHKKCCLSLKKISGYWLILYILGIWVIYEKHLKVCLRSACDQKFCSLLWTKKLFASYTCIIVNIVHGIFFHSHFRERGESTQKPY